MKTGPKEKKCHEIGNRKLQQGLGYGKCIYPSHMFERLVEEGSAFYAADEMTFPVEAEIKVK